MEIIAITVAAILGLYMLIQVLLAIFFANMIIFPQGRICPTEEDVRKRSVNPKAIDFCVYKNFDWTYYETWKKEKFIVKNGDYEIPAFYYPVKNSDKIAIVVHGFGQNHFAQLPQAKIFRDLGYSVLMIDQRRFGESKAQFGSLGYMEAMDVAKVCDFAKESLGAVKIVLNGVSMGAVSIMRAPLYTGNIDAVIPDCGYADIKTELPLLYKSIFKMANPFAALFFYRRAHKLGISIEDTVPIDVIEKAEFPICVIHSDIDSTVSVEDAYRISRKFRNPNSRVVIFEGLEHGLSVADNEKYASVIKEFLTCIEMF